MFYLSEVIGDGSNAEGNEFRPAFMGPGFAGCYEPDNSRVLCSVSESLPNDPRWLALDSVDLEARGVPTADLSNTGDVAQRVARRFLMRQFLKADDFPPLSMLIKDIPAAKRQRIKNKLLAQGVDMSDVAGSMTIREGLLLLLPRLKMKPFGIPNAPAPRGSFTDDFNRSDENLETSANWTQVDGSAGDAAIRSNKLADDGNAEASYHCPDQSSADHYTQALFSVAAFSFQVAVRITDVNNFFALRFDETATDWQLFKRDTGSFTNLGSDTVTAIGTGKIEASGNNIEVFVGGVSKIGPVTDAFNNTETRQGVVPRHANRYDPWADDFEAGTISSGSFGDGAGASAGAGTASSISSPLADSVGASAGVGAAAAVGSAQANSVGESAGVAVAASVGAPFGDGAGSSAGIAVATSVGAPFGDGAGSSAGAGVASGVTSAQADSAGLSAGAAFVLGRSERLSSGGQLPWIRRRRR